MNKTLTKKKDMATRNFVWLTAPSGTEGTSTVYVDSDFGSDKLGNGTRQRPYQTLGRAYSNSTKPSTIVCKGYFSEPLSQGNHGGTLRGDYLGAATFDGQGVYIIYGFGHRSMIIKNVPNAQGEEPVYSGSHLLAGVGRAYGGVVGSAAHVHGVAGPSVCLHKTALYMGCIGGTSAVEHCVYDSPVHNSTYLIYVGGEQLSQCLKMCTVYGVPDIADRCKGQYGASVVATIFSRFAMVGNEKIKRTFNGCVFAADCTWWWLTNDKGNSGTPEQITLTGSTSAERQQSLLDALTTKGIASNLMPVFTDCIFSTQTYDQLFNDAENGDFTLVPGCDADWLEERNTYCGALPPALRIPIMADSTGHAGTWDERSASGFVKVDTIDEGLSTEHDAIVIDPNSASLDGELYSKILTINPAQIQLNSVWAEVDSHISSHLARMWKEQLIDTTAYDAGDTLPTGLYRVFGGAVTYGNEEFYAGENIFVTTSDTTFAGDGTLREVIDPSTNDVLYCRCRSVVYARVGVTDYLQRGATYLNDGNQNITYHNRTIVPGESFVCMITDEQFTCADSTYKIAVMFDDTRVPASEWIPARLMADYFVGKSGGAIVTDEYGIPYSSGNPRSYSQTLLQSVLDRIYVQFAVIAKRYE